MRTLLALGLAAALAGCSASQLKTAAADSTAAVDAVATVAHSVAVICSAPQTQALINQAASLQPNVTSDTGVLLANAQASCTASGQVASTLVPNMTSTTPAWLADVLSGLSTAAQLAPIVLPLL